MHLVANDHEGVQPHPEVTGFGLSFCPPCWLVIVFSVYLFPWLAVKYLHPSLCPSNLYPTRQDKTLGYVALEYISNNKRTSICTKCSSLGYLKNESEIILKFFDQRDASCGHFPSTSAAKRFVSDYCAFSIVDSMWELYADHCNPYWLTLNNPSDECPVSVVCMSLWNILTKSIFTAVGNERRGRKKKSYDSRGKGGLFSTHGETIDWAFTRAPSHAKPMDTAYQKRQAWETFFFYDWQCSLFLW